MPRRISLGLLLTAMVVVSAPAVQAAASSLVTSNTRLDFENGNNVQAITIANAGSAPVRVQARILRWHDSGIAEVYSATEDIGFSPALFTLTPRASQVIRFAVLAPRGASEIAYRLIIDQLPDIPSARHVMLPVRLIIPVFVGATDSNAAPHLSWRASAHDGRATLTAFNSGTVHARLSDLSCSENGKPRMILAGLAGYVLPGESHSWTFPFRGTSLDIAATTEQGPIHQTIALTAP